MRAKPIPGKWYVLDMCGTPGERIMGGPFDTEREAERERRLMCIAEDCISARCPAKVQP